MIPHTVESSMANTERVTITLPKDLLEEVDRLGGNRSRFIAQAVQQALYERERAAFRLSLENPHPESEAMAELGFAEWASQDFDDHDLVDMSLATPVRWTPDVGWEVLPK